MKMEQHVRLTLTSSFDLLSNEANKESTYSLSIYDRIPCAFYQSIFYLLLWSVCEEQAHPEHLVKV